MRLPRGALRELRRLLATNKNVVGFSATLKEKQVAGKGPGRQAIRIYVVRKLKRHKVPPSLLLPDSIGGVPVDVVAVGKLEPLAASPGHGDKKRPMIGGISIKSAWDSTTSGTLGYFVKDDKPPAGKKQADWYILTCAHVLDDSTTGLETMQPSAEDGGKKPDDYVGKLTDHKFDPVDAAIAKIDTGAKGDILGVPAPVGTKKAKMNMEVDKSGRTTGVTHGKVIDVASEWNIPYGTITRNYKGCILIENKGTSTDFCYSGDSGALIVESAEKNAIGLLIGRTGTSPYKGIANAIDKVLTAFPGKVLVQPGETWP